MNILPKKASVMRLRLKGFLTWDADRFGLHKDNLNVGLILSSRGIPYFALNLADYGATGIIHANPGEGKTCLIVEADEIHSEMNISRSDLVDSEKTMQFKDVLRQLLGELESSPEYLTFRQLPKQGKREAQAVTIFEEKKRIESEDQGWVVLDHEGRPPVVLMGEPENEMEVNAVLWKLEALGALPFVHFRTLAYPGLRVVPTYLSIFRKTR